MNFRIENLRMWRSGNWIKYESKSCISSLRLQHDQLLITSETKVLECLNINGKLKGILKDDVLILIISVIGQEVRKIKFQMREKISKCLQELSARFPIVAYGSVTSKNNIRTKYRKIEDVIKDAVSGKTKINQNHTIPMEFKNFVKLCLIDPLFPKLLIETEKILEK